MRRSAFETFIILLAISLLSLSSLIAGCETPQSTERPADDIEDRIPESGEQALQWLLEGNERFVAGTTNHSHESLQRRAMLAAGQKPYAIILGCADSRVPPELLFDAGLGDLFVIRVAGNVASEDEIGSIEYAVAHLHTRLVVVLGHESCGAVTAALGNMDAEPKELRQLIDRIRPGIADVDRGLPDDEHLAQSVEANVRAGVKVLRAIKAREGQNTAIIVGGVYELATGRVRMLVD